jgi:hypothetical protein
VALQPPLSAAASSSDTVALTTSDNTPLRAPRHHQRTHGYYRAAGRLHVALASTAHAACSHRASRCIAAARHPDSETSSAQRHCDLDRPQGLDQI